MYSREKKRGHSLVKLALLGQTMHAHVRATYVNYTMHQRSLICRPTFSDALPANFGARPVSRFPMIIHLNRREQLCGGARVNSIIALYSVPRVIATFPRMQIPPRRGTSETPQLHTTIFNRLVCQSLVHVVR